MNAIISPGSLQTRTPGVISKNDIYTLDEAKTRLRWSDAAVRSAKRKGLKLIKSGKRKYITGEEIFRYLQALSENQ